MKDDLLTGLIVLLMAIGVMILFILLVLALSILLAFVGF